MDLGIFFQNSIYVQFAMVCWAVLISFWIISAFRVKRSARNQPWLRTSTIIIILIAVAIALSVASAVFTKSADTFIDIGSQLWQQTAATSALGDLVVFVGLAVAIWARITLGGNWSGKVELKENHELIESGPYHYVRHPIYSGMILMVLGYAILFDRVWGFILLAMVLAILVVKAFFEERLLEGHFPVAYRKYKARTKALVPFIF